MTTQEQVVRHYRHGALEKVLLDALAASGKDIDRLDPTDLSGVDEFHMGGRAATGLLARDLGLSAGQRLLDVGSGIGGPARHFASEFGCMVTGIDLTDEYVEVATELSRRCGLADRVGFRQGSALALPFDAAAFDVATLIHVGMNIAEKDVLFAEVRRVLKPGGRFGVYDVMRMDERDVPYPMPWAADPDTSFLARPETYRTLLAQAGFSVEQEVDRRQFALERWEMMRADVAKDGPPPLSLHTLIGPGSHERVGNVIKTLAEGTIAPIQMIARAA
jgi:SAM-dependent methyltransferase